MQRVLGLGSYKTAWSWLHKLRRAMVRPGRERLSGRVEVDETYLGGRRRGRNGRPTQDKALIVVAAQEEGEKIGRIRMQRMPDDSARRLTPSSTRRWSLAAWFEPTDWQPTGVPARGIPIR